MVTSGASPRWRARQRAPSGPPAGRAAVAANRVLRAAWRASVGSADPREDGCDPRARCLSRDSALGGAPPRAYSREPTDFPPGSPVPPCLLPLCSGSVIRACFGLWTKMCTERPGAGHRFWGALFGCGTVLCHLDGSSKGVQGGVVGGVGATLGHRWAFRHLPLPGRCPWRRAPSCLLATS